MATRLNDVVVDAADPAALGRFWSALLGTPVTGESAEEVDVAVAGGVELVFVPVTDPKTTKNRLHLDLASTSLDDQGAIVERAVSLGARPVDLGQRGVPWVVLADIEGNEFCVLEPRPEYSATGPVAAIVVDVADTGAQADFWSAATGLPIVNRTAEFASLRQESGPWLEFLHSDDRKRVKNRLHLDIAPGAHDDQAAEVARLLALGAKPVDVGQGARTWVVLADPEGQEFCVLSPR
ncbi:VOC family protein [Umezawaea sp. Da 62-37]|uniref:VOC family protein n=1 Tax=Umezawaea sp. Da 62-37 TaxID=3075927 RepID=UPI0028F6D333|nr:VOC family protein [Umezawaea sp. Da 62-37]WNV83582.1 VOC family protein [Umezawaea sp. Da 62-37]